MPTAPLRVEPSAASLAAGLDRIRDELEIPGAFPPSVEEEAQEAARLAPAADPGRRDRTGLSLVTIDPPGSRDLDQALLIERRGDGHRVRYAIADVAALVRPGGAVDREARARGVTLYLPDRRTPLHPDVLGEGAASLLPGQDRPALLWTIDLDGSGEAVGVEFERATVRSRAALGYGQVQECIDAGTADESLALLREVGERRLVREAARGGVSLSVPAQDIEHDGAGYRLRYESPLPVERWNAQVSLLTGICAARIMRDGGVGLFRVLAPAEESALDGAEAQRRRARRAVGTGAVLRRGRARPRPGESGPRGIRRAGVTPVPRRGLRGLGALGGRSPASPCGDRRLLRPRDRSPAEDGRPGGQRDRARSLPGRGAAGVGARGASGHARGHAPGGSPGAGRRAPGARLPRERAARRAGSASSSTRPSWTCATTGRWCRSRSRPSSRPLDARGPRPGEELRVRLAEADPEARRVVFTPAS